MPNVESTYSSWPRRLTKYVAGLRPEYSIYGVSFALVLAFFGLFFLSAWGDYRHTLNQSYITLASYHKLLEEYILRTLNTMDILLAGEVEQIEMHLSSAEIRSPDYHNRLVRTANALPAIWGLVVLDGNGVPVAGSRPMPPLASGLSELPFFRVHREEANEGLFISPPF